MEPLLCVSYIANMIFQILLSSCSYKRLTTVFPLPIKSSQVAGRQWMLFFLESIVYNPREENPQTGM